MKKKLFSLVVFIGLFLILWFGIYHKTPWKADEVLKYVVKPARLQQSPSQIEALIATPTEFVAPDDDVTWLKRVHAGLVISQSFDRMDYEPRGTVALGSLVTDLGETPPRYLHQIQTAACPVMLGEKHNRRFFRIYATSLCLTNDSVTQKYPLAVSYPKWAGSNAGMASSGGFVFNREEQPVRSIGVIVPKVIPENGETLENLDWQIQIRCNDRMSDVDVISKAKPQSLGPEFIVLMATHPDKMPASSDVVWFKFEENGTVSIKEK